MLLKLHEETVIFRKRLYSNGIILKVINVEPSRPGPDLLKYNTSQIINDKMKSVHENSLSLPLNYTDNRK